MALPWVFHRPHRVDSLTLTSETLQQALRAVPGVAAAELDRSVEASSGVVVRLDPDADPVVVGAEVRRVLAEHGLTSRLAAQDEADQPAESPRILAAPADLVGESQAATAHRLASLAVDESDAGVVVTATAVDGRRYSRRAPADDESVSEAVVAAVGALVEGRPARLIAMTVCEAEGSVAVTVILERHDGSRGAGSALVAAGRPYALARAVMAALRPD